MPCPWKNLEEKEEEGTRQKSHQILECSSGNTRTLEPEYSNNQETLTVTGQVESFFSGDS